jgi:hypothetical protein
MLPMMVVDCRADKVTTPPDMARVLRQLALDSKEKLVAVGKFVAENTLPGKLTVTVPLGGGVKVSVAQLIANGIDELFGKTLGEVSSLTSIIDSYKKFLANWPEGGAVPVIVIGAQPASGAAAPYRCCLLLRLAEPCPAPPPTTQLPLGRCTTRLWPPFLLQMRPTGS